jgi:hypothetical protein
MSQQLLQQNKLQAYQQHQHFSLLLLYHLIEQTSEHSLNYPIQEEQKVHLDHSYCEIFCLRVNRHQNEMMRVNQRPV